MLIVHLVCSSVRWSKKGLSRMKLYDVHGGFVSERRQPRLHVPREVKSEAVERKGKREEKRKKTENETFYSFEILFLCIAYLDQATLTSLPHTERIYPKLVFYDIFRSFLSNTGLASPELICLRWALVKVYRTTTTDAQNKTPLPLPHQSEFRKASKAEANCIQPGMRLYKRVCV